MCGILLIVSKDGTELDQSECFEALKLLEKRGPDHTVKKFIDKKIFFAQTILDITGSDNKQSGSHLKSDSGRYEILFNGEIYNFKGLKDKYFSSQEANPYQSIDTNILVNMFGKLKYQEVIKQLDGMYAFALYDNHEKTISISRDPQGEKSLFIYEDRSILIVSSIIPPILRLVKDISYDHQVIRNYFKTRHFMFIEDTPFQGIKQLKPGCSKTFNLENQSWHTIEETTILDWVNEDLFFEMRNITLNDATDRLDSIMQSTVKDMIPETKFASIVTGGIDSSLITSYLMDNSNPDIMIAINHIGKDYLSDDLSLFEKSFGNQIRLLDVDLDQYGKEISRCQKELCGPLFSHSFVGQSILSSDIKSAGCKVLFGGEAADELFGGYSCYFNFQDKMRAYNASPSDYTSYTDSAISFPEDDPKNYQNELSDAWKECVSVYSSFQDGAEMYLQAMMLFDAAYQVSSVGLRGADIMSSMWGIETRSMFLRKPIIEFILNIPVNLKVNQSASNDIAGTKPLLKNLFSRRFPDIEIQKKQGFAGFPNESIKFLGDYKDFKIFDILGIKNIDNSIESLSRETAWKMINLEFFFRNDFLNRS
tara:strand:- start:4120 stop:5898 length:1779 start_codon:yes stop_codon:yes gene_type:complete